MHTAYRLTGGLTSISEPSAVPVKPPWEETYQEKIHVIQFCSSTAYVIITLPKTNVAPNDPSFLEFSIFQSFETLLVSGRLSISSCITRNKLIHVNSIDIKHFIKHHVTNEVHQDRGFSKRIFSVVLNYRLTSQQRTRAGLATCGEFKLDIHGDGVNQLSSALCSP